MSFLRNRIRAAPRTQRSLWHHGPLARSGGVGKQNVRLSPTPALIAFDEFPLASWREPAHFSNLPIPICEIPSPLTTKCASPELDLKSLQYSSLKESLGRTSSERLSS